jgi:hypothetical protein
MTARLIALMTALAALPAMAQEAPAPVSKCLAMVENQPPFRPGLQPPVMFAKAEAGFAPIWRASTAARDVTLTYIDHSVWSILSPGGILAATDYYGLPMSPMPTIATMNNAHRTHWTPTPDPSIRHVLQGWSPDGVNPASHAIVEGDMLVRNVPTDIRWGGDMIANGNSIFIFEVADLCIGHLGHLHHPLEDRHYAQIGRLDIMMVPVDGGLTLSQEGMSELVKRLQPSVLLPMHLRGNSIERFISMLGDGYDSRYLSGNDVTFSIGTLPRRPTVFVPVSLN